MERDITAFENGSKASCGNSSAHPLPLRPVAALGQEQESSGTSGQARSRGGLGQRAV